MEALEALVGKGLAFPFTPTDTGNLALNTLIERINQSIYMFLETPKGSRLFLPTFGSEIYRYKFDPLDDVLKEKLRYTLEVELTKWEPRIDLKSIQFYNDTTNPNTLYTALSYNIHNTQVEASFVYPYSLEAYSSETN